MEKLLLGTTNSSAYPSAIDDDDFRISIAGAQEKDGVHLARRTVVQTARLHAYQTHLQASARRRGRTPLGHDCFARKRVALLTSAGGFGVPVAECEVKQFGATKVLVVTRFDRALHSSGRYWLRIPQEDLCQATGTPSASKYEADGGPGLPDIARILQGSTAREEDLSTLLRVQLLFWMLAATDGHAKNFSIRILAQGRYRLTPLYDILSAWPITGAGQNHVHTKKLRLAMALRGTNKHYRVHEIERRHFNATAKQCGFGPDMEPIIEGVIAKTPEVIAQVEATLPKRFPRALFESVTRGLERAAKQLGRMPP